MLTFWSPGNKRIVFQLFLRQNLAAGWLGTASYEYKVVGRSPEHVPRWLAELGGLLSRQGFPPRQAHP